MRNTRLSKGMLRQLERLEAATKGEWFDSFRIVYISAPRVEPAARQEMSNLNRDLGADQDMLARETGNPGAHCSSGDSGGSDGDGLRMVRGGQQRPQDHQPGYLRSF
jgi:hypothetical protein